MDRDLLFTIEKIANTRSLQRMLAGDYEFQTSMTGLVRITRDLQRESEKLKTKKFAHTTAGFKKHNQQVEKVDMIQNKFIQGVLHAHNHVSNCLKLMAHLQDCDNPFEKSFTDLIHLVDISKHDTHSLKIFNHFRNILAHNNPITIVEILSEDIFDDIIVEFRNVENLVFNFKDDNELAMKIMSQDMDKRLTEVLGD